MSYIAVELKAIEVQGPALARALGVELALAIGRLNLLWHRCWSMKTDLITTIELRGFFPEASAGDLLAAYGFLAADSEGWRVKGADRYLRLREQRVAAGKARSLSAGRSAGQFTSEKPAKRQRRTSDEPAEQPALTPSTEHRTPNQQLAPRDTDRLCDAFKAIIGHAYKFETKDGVALAELKKEHPIEEILRRWGIGLRQPSAEYNSCRGVAELKMKWNRLAEGPKATAEPKARLFE